MVRNQQPLQMSLGASKPATERRFKTSHFGFVCVTLTEPMGSEQAPAFYFDGAGSAESRRLCFPSLDG
jgi:hypothetical protein